MIIPITLAELTIRRGGRSSRRKRSDIAVARTGLLGGIHGGVVPSGSLTTWNSGDCRERREGSTTSDRPDGNFIGSLACRESDCRSTEDHGTVSTVGEDGVELGLGTDCYGCNVGWKSGFGEEGEV